MAITAMPGTLMKLTALVAVGLVLSATAANAHEEAPPQSLSSLLSNVLTSGPVSSLFSKIGINITKTLEKPNYWDERIPLITDDNYNEIIVNEPLSEEEEEARTWVMTITVTAGDSPRDSISRYLDQVFDNAYNESVIAGDLPNVRWGRIDYFNVTYLTTKWNIWSAPFLVILRNRGQELRFYRAQHLRLKEEELRKFLQAEDWKHTPPWSSSYAPGGSSEFVLHYFAVAMAKAYNLAVRVPKWLFVIVSGMFGSVLLSMMHGSASKPSATPVMAPTSSTTAPAQVSEKTASPPSSEASGSAPSTPERDSLKKRKRKRK